MFIRWQSRKKRRAGYGRNRGPDVHWAAILAKTVRVNGGPAQQHMAYLGGITESAIRIRAERCYFWDHVTETLNKLGNRIAPEERLRLENKLAERVPLPTHADFRKTAQRRASYWSDPADQKHILNSTCRAALKRWPAKSGVGAQKRRVGGAGPAGNK